MTIAEIIQSIDNRLDQLQREITTLQETRNGLVNGARGAAPVERPERKKRQPRKPAAAERPKPTRIVPAGVLERLLADSDGLTTSALAQQAGGDREQVLTLLKELEAEGRVRRSGQRRGTRWRLFTEEDAIAERAAQLAAQSRTWMPAPTST
jgi:hypothetical protein